MTGSDMQPVRPVCSDLHFVFVDDGEDARYLKAADDLKDILVVVASVSGQRTS